MFNNQEVIVQCLNRRRLHQPYLFNTTEVRAQERNHDATLRANLCHGFLEGRRGFGLTRDKIETVEIQLLSDQVHRHNAGMTRIGNTFIPCKDGKYPPLEMVLKRIATLISASGWLRNERLFLSWLNWMNQEDIYPELSHLVKR